MQQMLVWRFQCLGLPAPCRLTFALQLIAVDCILGIVPIERPHFKSMNSIPSPKGLVDIVRK